MNTLRMLASPREALDGMGNHEYMSRDLFARRERKEVERADRGAEVAG